MLFTTNNRRVCKVSKTVEEPKGEFVCPLLPKLANTRRGWRELVDTTDDNDGAVMPVSVAAQVERKHKAKRGKKKVKKIIGVIGKAMATPFIPDLHMFQTPPEYGRQSLQLASTPPPMLSAGVFMFPF